MPKVRVPDEVVTTGVAKTDIPGTILDPDVIESGTILEMASIIRTPVGLRFRIKNSTRWVSENDLSVDVSPDQIIDYTGTYAEELVPESWKKNANKNKAVSKKIRNNEIGCKSRIRFVTNKYGPIKGQLIGALGMDKQVLRSALTGLNPDDRLTVTFLGEKASESGEFTVIRTRKGRGKGGSQLVELRSAAGESLTTGTPESDMILHVVTPDGTLHGHESESDVPLSFETDAARAVSLKEAFKGLIDHCSPLPKESENDTRSRYVPSRPVNLSVQSSYAPFDGNFALVQLELKRGRYGKIVLLVQPDGSETTTTLDSFQHSGVITSFEVTETPLS
jgi:hypothetical protein